MRLLPQRISSAIKCPPTVLTLQPWGWCLACSGRRKASSTYQQHLNYVVSVCDLVTTTSKAVGTNCHSNSLWDGQTPRTNHWRSCSGNLQYHTHESTIAIPNANTRSQVDGQKLSAAIAQKIALLVAANCFAIVEVEATCLRIHL